MYKFGQIEILSKEFNTEYKVTENVDLEKIRLSEEVVANKQDTTIGDLNCGHFLENPSPPNISVDVRKFWVWWKSTLILGGKGLAIDEMATILSHQL